MEDTKPAAKATRRTGRPHKPTRKAQESAAQTGKQPKASAPPPPREMINAEETIPRKQPEDMTVEELLEQIDAPMREYLEAGDNKLNQPLPSAWDHHKQLRDQAEADERSDCESDPEVTAAMMDEMGTNEESSEDGDSSPELLSPPQSLTTQIDPNVWNTLQTLISQSHERMERMEDRANERFKRLEERVIRTVQESSAATEAQITTIHSELH